MGADRDWLYEYNALVAYLTRDFGSYATFGSTSLITRQSPSWAWDGHFDIPSGSDALTVTNSGSADAAPNLTSFSVSPTSADVGTATRTFTVSAVLTDPQGVADADVDFFGTNGILTGISLTRTSGTATNGTWTGSFTVPRYSIPGRVGLTLRFRDSVGQRKRFGMQPFAGALDEKFDGRLRTMANATVTLTNIEVVDLLPPQASEVSVSPNPATFALGETASVTITARVKDAPSGTNRVEVTLDGFNFHSLCRASGDASDGIYSGMVELSRTEYSPGVYPLSIYSEDEVGNQSIFTPTIPGVPEVTLAVLPGGYDEWAINNNLLPPDDEPLAQPQGDGISNALKFASNLDPGAVVNGAQRILDPVSGTSGLPVIR